MPVVVKDQPIKQHIAAVQLRLQIRTMAVQVCGGVSCCKSAEEALFTQVQQMQHELVLLISK
jgi:NADH:ubiquinone oxidoreductase subunit E